MPGIWSMRLGVVSSVIILILLARALSSADTGMQVADTHSSRQVTWGPLNVAPERGFFSIRGNDMSHAMLKAAGRRGSRPAAASFGEVSAPSASAYERTDEDADAETAQAAPIRVPFAEPGSVKDAVTNALSVPSVRDDGSELKGILVMRDATVDGIVPHVQATARAAHRVILELGGYLSASQLTEMENGYGGHRSVQTFKVPARRFDEAVDVIRALVEAPLNASGEGGGIITSEHSTAEDVTAECACGRKQARLAKRVCSTVRPRVVPLITQLRGVPLNAPSDCRYGRCCEAAQ